jgi:hypothetical protein
MGVAAALRTTHELDQASSKQWRFTSGPARRGDHQDPREEERNRCPDSGGVAVQRRSASQSF